MTTDSHQFLYQEHQPQRADQRAPDPDVAPMAQQALPRDLRNVAHLLQTRSVGQPEPIRRAVSRHDPIPVMVEVQPVVDLRQRMLRVLLLSSLIGLLWSSLMDVGLF